MAKVANSVETEPSAKGLDGAPLETVSATEAKNGFGVVLDRVASRGPVAITKHDEVRAVVLSIEDYRQLLSNQYDPLHSLREEFERKVAGMQGPRARASGRALFDASGEQLGRAARANAKRRATS